MSSIAVSYVSTVYTAYSSTIDGMNGTDHHTPSHDVSCDWDDGIDHLVDVLRISMNAYNANHDLVHDDIVDGHTGHCASKLWNDWNDAIAS